MDDFAPEPLYGGDPLRLPARGSAVLFGARLREWRLAAGLSLSGLAERVHYSKSQLSKIENGHRPPTADLARLCDAVLGARGKLAELVLGALPASGADLDANPAYAGCWTLDLPTAGPGTMTWRELPGGTAAGQMVLPVPGWPGPEDPVPDLAALGAIFDSVRRFGQLDGAGGG